MPTRNIFGWQKPCYLLGEGYAKTFRELMETTDWDSYGTGKLREVRELHGALRLRADRGGGHDRAAAGRRSRSRCSASRTEGPMAPEIPLDKQRPAEFVFSRHVEHELAAIHKRREAARHSDGSGGEVRPEHSAELLHPERHRARIGALEVAVARERPQREELRIAVVAQIEHARETGGGVARLVPEAVVALRA